MDNKNKRNGRTERKQRTSQSTVDRRMREVWIDGFGLYPKNLPDEYLQQVRTALRNLVDNDQYWERVKALVDLKREQEVLMDCLKNG